MSESNLDKLLEEFPDVHTAIEEILWNYRAVTDGQIVKLLKQAKKIGDGKPIPFIGGLIVSLFSARADLARVTRKLEERTTKLVKLHDALGIPMTDIDRNAERIQIRDLLGFSDPAKKGKG